MAGIKNTETGAYRSDDATRAEYAARDFSPPYFPFPPDVRVQDAAQPSFNALTQDVAEADPVLVNGVWTQAWSVVDVAADVAAARRSASRSDASLQIDNAVAAVYGRFTRFAQEYEDRETQAQAFKDAGYTGTVPQQVAAFATPAGKTPQEAADLILSQAAQLRGALAQLGVLRMRKYEVLRAATDADAATSLATILANVKAISEALG